MEGVVAELAGEVMRPARMSRSPSSGKLSILIDKSVRAAIRQVDISQQTTGRFSPMAYSIYGMPYKPTEKVFYGTVETLDCAVVELKRLRKAGIADVYAIGVAPELANLPLSSAMTEA